MQLIIIMFKNTFDSIEPNLHIHSYIHTHVYMFKHMCMCVIIVFVFFFSRFPVATAILQRNYSAAQRTGCVQLLRHPLQARHPVRKSMCVCVRVCLSGFSALLLPGSSSAYTQNKGQHDDRLVSIVEFVPDHGLVSSAYGSI